ncbi:lipase 2 [Purpureocillium lavendulum]|uniref:Lipase 2 n=1 Tax=Purpureocillium lavendulum TaxID=1247861 RepID=A0AB34G6L4_9HYPO|nr:lipase 2 [Purpureocillium lavendulum]
MGIPEPRGMCGEPMCLAITAENACDKFPELDVYPRPEPSKSDKDYAAWYQGYQKWGRVKCSCGNGYFCRRHGQWIPGCYVTSGEALPRERQGEGYCPATHYTDNPEGVEVSKKREAEKSKQPTGSSSKHRQGSSAASEHIKSKAKSGPKSTSKEKPEEEKRHKRDKAPEAESSSKGKTRERTSKTDLTTLDRTLCFSHGTVKDFLLSTEGTMQSEGITIRRDEPDSVLAEQCLRCLLKSQYAELDRIGRRLRTNVGLGGSTEDPDSSFFDYAARHWHIHLSAIQKPDDELVALAGTFLRSLQFSYWAEYSYTDNGDFQAIRSAEIRLRGWAKGLPPATQGLLHLDAYFEATYRHLSEEYSKTDCDKVLQWLALMRLGFYYFDVGRITDMGQVRAQVAEGLIHLLGPRHPLTLQARSDAAYAPLFGGEVRKAHQLYVDIAEDMRAVNPEVEEPNLFWTLLFQGQAEYLMNDIAKALETLACVKAGFLRTLGPESNGFLAAQLRYAQVDASKGNTTRSIETLEEVRQIRERQYGTDDSFAVTTRLYIGDLYRIKRDSRSLANLERGVDFRRQFMPISHLVTLDPAIILAIAYRDFEMNYAAEDLVEELETHGMLEGQDRFVRYCQVKHLRALLLFDGGETDRAIDLLQGLLIQTDREQNNRALLWVRQDLARMLRYRGRDGDQQAATVVFNGLVCQKSSGDDAWGDEPDSPRLLHFAEKAVGLVRERKVAEAERLLETEGLQWVREADLWLNMGIPGADTTQMQPPRELGNGDDSGAGYMWVNVDSQR